MVRHCPPGAKPVMAAIQDAGILAAIRVDVVADALKAVDALYEAGLTVCEIAMSSPHTVRILDAVIDHTENRMSVGAGTVLDTQTAARCVQAGAQFIVSPTLNRSVVRYCRRYSIPVIPGAFTPTEILAAWEAGASCVKVFPACSGGGPDFIRAVKAPLPQVDLLPMGGVSVANAEDYIRAGAFALGVGNDLISASKIARQDVSEIVGRVRDYSMRIDEARAPRSAERSHA